MYYQSIKTEDIDEVQSELQISKEKSQKLFKYSIAISFYLLVIGIILYLTYSTTYYIEDKVKLNAQLAIDRIISFKSLDERVKSYLFKEFKLKYKRNYESSEHEEKKFHNFKLFFELIDERNEKERHKGGSAIHGITKFADYTQDEFRSLLGYKKGDDKTEKILINIPQYLGEKSSVDWTGIYTTPIKDQGRCGSCWAFSAVQQIESDSIRAGLSTINENFSVQQVLSCDEKSNACAGGTTDSAYKYIMHNHGIESAAFYPYTSYYANSSACNATSSLSEIQVTGYYGINNVIESSLVDYVLGIGPLSICLDANDWNSYYGGVVSSCGNEIDHCVQAVGVDINKKVWKIRNTWHDDWGENGYIYLKMNENMCGLTYNPSFVTTKRIHKPIN